MVGRSAPLDRNATPLLLDDGRYSLLAAAAAAVAITSVNPAIIGGARRSFGTVDGRRRTRHVATS